MKVDRRVMLEPRALRGLLELQALRDQPVCLDQKGLVVLKALLVPQVSPEPLEESDLLDPMVTLVQPVLLVLLVKTGLRVSEETVVLLEDLETLVYGVRLVLQERREILEKTALTVRMVPRVPRVWPVSVVSSVFQDREAKEDSPACLDPPVSRVSRGLLEDPGTEDLLALWGHQV